MYANSVFGQDHLLQSKVSTLVASHFFNDYPTATDVEMEKELYKVEFKSGNDIDHDMWYMPTVEIVKLKEDATQNELPQAVLSTINTDFNG